VRGAADYKAFYSAFRGALPDVKVTVEDAVCAGDMVAVRCRAAGTHSGEGIGKRPTNNPVDFNFMAFARIADGKIAEAWNVVDFMKMYSQIDALDLRLDDQ
jgi:predicted ester cyclase